MKTKNKDIVFRWNETQNVKRTNQVNNGRFSFLEFEVASKPRFMLRSQFPYIYINAIEYRQFFAAIFNMATIGNLGLGRK